MLAKGKGEAFFPLKLGDFHMIAYTDNDRYKAKGYLELLLHSSPNGRVTHDVSNAIQVLRLSIDTEYPITAEYEQVLKDLINELYQVA